MRNGESHRQSLHVSSQIVLLEKIEVWGFELRLGHDHMGDARWIIHGECIGRQDAYPGGSEALQETLVDMGVSL